MLFVGHHGLRVVLCPLNGAVHADEVLKHVDVLKLAERFLGLFEVVFAFVGLGDHHQTVKAAIGKENVTAVAGVGFSADFKGTER